MTLIAILIVFALIIFICNYTAELSALIEWDFDMNGPTRYYWHTNMLREKSEEELHEFYKKLRNGDFYNPIPEITEYKEVTLPRYQKTVS